MSLLATLDGFFAAQAPAAASDRLVVAFSGGPDSTALLAATGRWGRRRGLEIVAAHLDHGLDPDSARRAREAARLAGRLGVEAVVERRPVTALRRRGESLEAAARRLRYEFLERVRRARGARYVVTAHHRDDQAETVLLRLLQGSGAAGLGAIVPRRGSVVRPLLAVPRRQLAGWLAEQTLDGVEPVDDATNRDLTRPRNLVRHRLLPALAARSPELPGDLARLAEAARAARSAVDRRLTAALAPYSTEHGLEIERRQLAALPPALFAPALALLHRRAGARHPPSAAATREAARQLAAGAAVGIDCGDGWTLTSRGERLILAPRPRPAAPFAYTLTLPGEVELPAGNGKLRLSRGTARPWMFGPSSWRAGLALGLNAGDRITVRSRRPGDRIRPLGCSYDRRLKDVLIDRKVPRPARDRLPLLCIAGRVVWVPGVTLDERCRLAQGETAWVAEWEKR